MLRRGRGFTEIPGWGALLALCLTTGTGRPASAAAKPAQVERNAHRMAGRLPGKPAYLWLWYADGGPAPVDSQYCGDIVPPAFQCNYGSGIDSARVDDCKQQVQTLLDAWYKDFNLVFTLTRPPSGDFYTVIITSGWAKCQDTLPPNEAGMDPSQEAGIAPGNGCIDNPGQTALAIECGHNAHDCATIIAHEHGHLVGLEHTASRTDVMYSTILSSAAGFDRADSNIVDDLCDLKTQGSYQTMLAALGAWPGGTKPSPFGNLPDAGSADLPPATTGVDASSSGGSVGPSPAATGVDGGVVVLVQGFDGSAMVRPRLPTVDAAEAGNTGARGGCNMLHTPAGAAAPVAVFLFLLALCARRAGLRWSAARAHGASARRPKPRHFLA
jgi:hypothetical protein